MDAAFATSIADAVRERFLGPPTDDLPIELPVTALGEVARLLREAQELNMQRTQQFLTTRTMINDKLAQARILVDVLRGDGE